jgi:hypothetical protein
MSIAHRPETPDTVHDRCPGCADLISAQLQILTERLADVARLPHLMLVCGGCQRTFVIVPPLARKAAVSRGG